MSVLGVTTFNINQLYNALFSELFDSNPLPHRGGECSFICHKGDDGPSKMAKCSPKISTQAKFHVYDKLPVFLALQNALIA